MPSSSPPTLVIKRPSQLVSIFLTLEVSVIDAVTGRVIVSHEVQNAMGPVKGVVSENWVAYHYWDTVNARWTMGVIDMYHPQPKQLASSILNQLSIRSTFLHMLLQALVIATKFGHLGPFPK